MNLETIVQVRSEIIHEPDWEHKADAELLRERPRLGNAAALKVEGSYLKDLELNSRHFESGFSVCREWLVGVMVMWNVSLKSYRLDYKKFLLHALTS